MKTFPFTQSAPSRRRAVMPCAMLALSLLLPAAEAAQSRDNPKTATIRGTLTNFAERVEIEDFSDLQRIAPPNAARVIQADKNASFSITLPLAAPGYFRLGRNVLYLSPGDDLTVGIDHNGQTRSQFQGTGSVANTYLRGTPFPKGGSFLMAGMNIKETPKETLDTILRLADERKAELQSAQGVSAEFRELETARIRADTLQSILKTKTYLSAAFARKPKESRDAYFEEFTRLARPIQDSLLRDFVNTKYLQLEVYRDLYMSTDWAGATNNAAVPQEMKDWKAATRLALQIKAASDKSALADFKPEVAAIATPRYRSALQDLLTHKMKFGIGDVAADFSAVDDRGNTVKLSSLKGRVIYVDVWATWCGPCMAEMPKLELLKQRYAGNESLAIVSLSIDNKKDAWLKNLADRKPGGRQWLIDRASMPDYEIEAIPRCILIDKDFKVVDLNAPRPSHNAITNLLDRLLAK